MRHNFFFIGLPYVTLVLFFGGLIYRAFGGFMGNYRGKWDWTVRGDYYWTTRSTGFFGRASIGPAALCIHWGVIILFFAHLIGLIGGTFSFAGWVDFFRWVGFGSGILFLYGLSWALYRRVTIPQIRAMSVFEDYVILLFLILITSLGLYQSAVKLVFGISYSVGPWIGSILKFKPDASAMVGIPLVNQLHIVLALLFFAYIPFTKLVHVFSYPFGYLTRNFISMRRYEGVKR